MPLYVIIMKVRTVFYEHCVLLSPSCVSSNLGIKFIIHYRKGKYINFNFIAISYQILCKQILLPAC